MDLFKMCWRVGFFFFLLSFFFFLNRGLFLALLPAFMWCCFNSFVDVWMCCLAILRGGCARCTITRGLWGFDATGRAYLKTRAQEHGISWVFASAFSAPHRPLKAATQESFHLFRDTECSYPRRKDSNALSEPKNFCLRPRQKNIA